jgi:hypothetical protein
MELFYLILAILALGYGILVHAILADRRAKKKH